MRKRMEGSMRRENLVKNALLIDPQNKEAKELQDELIGGGATATTTPSSPNFNSLIYFFGYR